MDGVYREHEDFDTIAGLLADAFGFSHPCPNFPAPAGFTSFLREFDPRKNRSEVRKLIADDGDVAVLNEFPSATPMIGALPFYAGSTLRMGKIVSRVRDFDAWEFTPWIAV